MKGKRGQLIPILQQTQGRFGYLPKEEMVKVAELCGVTESTVFGVASFYALFRFTPIGKTRVMVCRGTACHVRGARQIMETTEKVLGIKEGQTTPDLEYTLESVACIGCCALGPCIMTIEITEGQVTSTVHGRLNSGKVREIFAGGRE
ncbi:NADH-quinone oxidoreductase subunit E [Candidatus Hakubella thermalkaliphila]|uniref:NADH-quinone oxidoreductase subunit E n=1 Tax=Candidatus Hakubella thermalkaliphila TaxID=2754717 RepID=A0A6V8PG05_9ACTN|nr:NAD(P)H-dependent oxidoreductase subunit E [Candidatus Hakubella thermalkaliphila]GFP31188.1 NADH-quinone oxidoreductase subunit E [Candidatus Hakubella thermalkaliphila]GFP37763.1 NADH-quinone oxidoreductase subunit E [Candidatus Hakubella thermalkaliphila]